jgi:hypothetical protein
VAGATWRRKTRGAGRSHVGADPRDASNPFVRARRARQRSKRKQRRAARSIIVVLVDTPTKPQRTVDTTFDENVNATPLRDRPVMSGLLRGAAAQDPARP